MTVEELRELRNQNQVSLLELAAMTGLPKSYLEKIEEKSIVALEADWKRIEKALELIQKTRLETGEAAFPNEG